MGPRLWSQVKLSVMPSCNKMFIACISKSLSNWNSATTSRRIQTMYQARKDARLSRLLARNAIRTRTSLLGRRLRVVKPKFQSSVQSTSKISKLATYLLLKGEQRPMLPWHKITQITLWALCSPQRWKTPPRTILFCKGPTRRVDTIWSARFTSLMSLVAWR